MTVGGDDVLVGSVVDGRHHVAGILGQGTTGTVFGVESLRTGRRGAMKVLRPRYSDAEAVHRVFHGDARAAWSVVHPCLCEVSDAAALPDGAPFFVMEYLEGETLAHRMARERMSLASAVDAMMQILSAIDAIHARALLLRDLRPENVLLVHRRGCRPLVKILDFGLARLTPLEKLAEAWEADAPGSALHPHYVSPERTRSELAVEPASDLFVAGILFYEMLTGRRPFSAQSWPALMLAIAQAAPAPLAHVRDDVAPELEAFVRRALAGNPRMRHASARAMQDELRGVFEGVRRRSGGSTSIAATEPPPQPSSGFGDVTEPDRKLDPRLVAMARGRALLDDEEEDDDATEATKQVPAALRAQLEAASAAKGDDAIAPAPATRRLTKDGDGG